MGTCLDGLTPVDAMITGFEVDWIGSSMTTIILSGMAGAIPVTIFITTSTDREHDLSQALGQSIGD